MKANNLTLPIYLNQKFVFDLLAMLDNGFSHVETIKTSNNSSISDNRSSKGEIGINNAFAFLKFGVYAEASNNKESESLIELSKEKVHTPNSLFVKLRDYLDKNSSIITENFLNAKPGEFAEVKLSLRKNPIIEALETMLSLMKMANVFDEQPNKSKQKGNPNNKTINQIESMLEQLKDEGGIDLVGEYNNLDYGTNFKVLITLDRSYLNDPSLSDIADGQFSVLGKITRVLGPDSDEEINLLRKTSLSKLSSNILKQMFSGFSDLPNDTIKPLNISTEIKGPAIQLIPIAIFI